ncbi:21539_t:CDS:2 [Gigaspora rosea]|nr:21539_t:CDS:2 [Gigaspora rosea]
MIRKNVDNGDIVQERNEKNNVTTNCSTENILENFENFENFDIIVENKSDTSDENNYTTDDDNTTNNERSTYNLRKRKRFLNSAIDYSSHESDNLEIDVVNDFSDTVYSSDSGIDRLGSLMQTPVDDLYDSSEVISISSDNEQESNYNHNNVVNVINVDNEELCANNSIPNAISSAAIDVTGKKLLKFSGVYVNNLKMNELRTKLTSTQRIREAKNLHPISIGKSKDCNEWLQSDAAMELWKNRPARMVHVRKRRRPNGQSRIKNRDATKRTRSLSQTRQYKTRSKPSSSKNKPSSSKNIPSSKNKPSKKNDTKTRTTLPIKGKLIPSTTGGKSHFIMESYFQNFMKLNQNEESSESSDFNDSNESNYSSNFYDSNESNYASDFYNSNESNHQTFDFYNSDESNHQTSDFYNSDESHDSDESNETFDFLDSGGSNDANNFHGSITIDISEDEESEETSNYLATVKRKKNQKENESTDSNDILNTRKDYERPFNQANDWDLPFLGSSPIHECSRNSHVQFYEISTPSTDVNAEESYYNIKSDFNFNNDDKIVKKTTEKIIAEILDDSSDLSTEDEEETVVLSSENWSMSQNSTKTHIITVDDTDSQQQCSMNSVNQDLDLSESPRYEPRIGKDDDPQLYSGIFESLDLSTPTYELTNDSLFDQTVFSVIDLNTRYRPTTPASEVNMSLEECIKYSHELTPLIDVNAYNDECVYNNEYNINQYPEIVFDEYYSEKTKDEVLDDYLQDLGGNYNDGWYTPIWEVEDSIADLFRPLLDEQCVT